ncbi:hypothetical protein CTA1_245 [Colletotrichum tanaceti]|uniref:Uncharacterized protein n=1 Tax=Colletotrichum tanaceti TaxID=1306861 RepID=A0A4U6X4T7_9PEZI|nr:hypothetical protein CTA1_245 [Colletotrichum tanaceti]
MKQAKGCGKRRHRQTLAHRPAAGPIPSGVASLGTICLPSPDYSLLYQGPSSYENKVAIDLRAAYTLTDPYGMCPDRGRKGCAAFR